jgi:AraC family transcriptional regulator
MLAHQFYAHPSAGIPARPRLIHEEPEWRRPSIIAQLQELDSKTVASRWMDITCQRQSVSDRIQGDYHTIAIALRSTELSFFVDERKVYDGQVAAGLTQISGPDQRVVASFRAPCEMLHLHVANKALQELYDEAEGRPLVGKIEFPDLGFHRDPVIAQLSKGILAADAVDCPIDTFYGDTLSLAIALRLLKFSTRPIPLTSSRVTALPNWKLRRVCEFIDENLGQTITLADMARSIGLTRMHFAAQFRAATGERPHDFLLRNRIERAQRIMATSDATLVQVALSVGFQSQAHFGTVFKKVVGITPSQWLRSNDRFCWDGNYTVDCGAADCLCMLSQQPQGRGPDHRLHTRVEAAAARQLY